MTEYLLLLVVTVIISCSRRMFCEQGTMPIRCNARQLQTRLDSIKHGPYTHSTLTYFARRPNTYDDTTRANTRQSLHIYIYIYIYICICIYIYIEREREIMYNLPPYKNPPRPPPYKNPPLRLN